MCPVELSHTMFNEMSLPCRDIYEAIERHSAALLRQVQAITTQWGWGVKPYSWMLMAGEHGQGGLISVVATTVSLPLGRGASFTPRPAPKEDGRRWVIDIRRTDRVQRGDWAEGLTVTFGPGRDQSELLHRGVALSDATLAAILHDLARP